jgi:hypothetical protein
MRNTIFVFTFLAHVRNNHQVIGNRLEESGNHPVSIFQSLDELEEDIRSTQFAMLLLALKPTAAPLRHAGLRIQATVNPLVSRLHPAMTNSIHQLQHRPTSVVMTSPEVAWPADKVRETFISYFGEQAHTFVPSSPVVPLDDPTLLFANAGMNQFKPIFVGQAQPGTAFASLKRAANSQKMHPCWW